MEYLDICDEQGFPTGKIVERAEAHRLGIRHRTAHVWVVRYAEGRLQVLLQRRSLTKDSFPGRLDTSSAGHIPAGSEPLPSALRELEEELGIRAEADDLQYIGWFDNKYKREFYGKTFQDNEHSSVYVCRKSVNISALHLQKEELEEVVWKDFEETYAACRRRDPAYCVPIRSLEALSSAIPITM